MNSRMISAALASAGMAAGALAQDTVKYCFRLNDTGNGDAIIEPGESALISLWATVTPDQSGSGGGFAGSIYDIMGVRNWDTGTVDWHETTDQFSRFGESDGILQLNNDITGIEAFRLPAFVNPEFDFSNPIEIYRMQWTPHDWSWRTVEVAEGNHLNNTVYTDEFGTIAEFSPDSCGTLTFRVVPSPGALALLSLGGLAAARRRQR